MCLFRSCVVLFVRSRVDFRIALVLSVKIDLDGVDHLETRLGFHFEINVRSLSSLDGIF